MPCMETVGAMLTHRGGQRERREREWGERERENQRLPRMLLCVP